jgi:hypothetical protein
MGHHINKGIIFKMALGAGIVTKLFAERSYGWGMGITQSLQCIA